MTTRIHDEIYKECERAKQEAQEWREKHLFLAKMLSFISSEPIKCPSCGLTVSSIKINCPACDKAFKLNSKKTSCPYCSKPVSQITCLRCQKVFNV